MKDDLIYLDKMSEETKVKIQEAYDKLTPEQRERMNKPVAVIGFLHPMSFPKEDDLMIGIDLSDEDCFVLPERAELEIIPGSEVEDRKQNWNPPPKTIIGAGVLDNRRVLTAEI